jgi:hypothetical protein
MHVAPHRPSQQSLAAFVEALAVDKHVLVIGDASDRLASSLLDLGARAVELWDPEDERAAFAAKQASRGLVVRPLPRDASDVRVSAFDLAIVTDLGALEDVEQWVRWIRRWVGQTGVAVFSAPCGPPPEHFEYYELYDIIAGQFPNVRMVGQVPFSGVAFAEFGVAEDAVAVTVDGQLADGAGAPEAFLAVASQQIVSLEPYLIVQLPPSETSAPDKMMGELEGGREAPHSSMSELEGGREAPPELPRPDPLRELRLALDDKEAEAARLAKELDAHRDEAAKLASELKARGAEVGTLRSDVERLHAALEKAQAHVRLEAERIERQSGRAETAERQLAAARSELAKAAETQTLEVARYEEALREGAKSIRTLEAEVARRERMIHELLDEMEEPAGSTPSSVQAASGELEGGRQAPPSSIAALEGGRQAPPSSISVPQPSERNECAELRARLDALAVELAKREGEAQASAWKIAELEAKLEAELERPLAECLASEP